MAIDVKDMYSRLGPMVLRRCQRLLGDKEEAADAMLLYDPTAEEASVERDDVATIFSWPEYQNRYRK